MRLNKKIFLILTVMSFLANSAFAQFTTANIYVVDPAVGNLKDKELKVAVAKYVNAKFAESPYFMNTNNNIVGAGKAIVLDALTSFPDEKISTAAKAFKGQNARFVAVLSLDEVTEELCTKLKLPYAVVSKAADYIITLTIVDKYYVDTKDPLSSVYTAVYYGKN